MSRWPFPLTIDPEASTPMFLQIAQAISDDIRRGRLGPGDRLPGSRSLAIALDVHRNTVQAALAELQAQGWIVARRGQGTFVSGEIPRGLPDPAAHLASRSSGDPGRGKGPGFTLAPARELDSFYTSYFAAPHPGHQTIVLASGMPDLRLVPVESLARAYRRALRMSGSALLGYGDPRGHLRLRTELAAMLSTMRGLSLGADRLIVTRGSQMALDLACRALLRPGDAVAVEALGYRPAWQALELAGAELVPIAVDRQGLDVGALARVLDSRPLRAVYLTPHHQYPTTVTLSPGRRLQLMDLARRHGLAIFEDDYDFEFHYDGRPVLPLAASDPGNHVIYLGTLSKILAPGLRLGFVVGPDALIARMAAIRALCDRQGDHGVECAVAELIADGELQRHSRRTTRIYRERRDALAQALRAHLPGIVRFEVAHGGMALWIDAGPDVDMDAWARRGLALNVQFNPASRFALDGRNRPSARLGFASLDGSELEEAARRMAAAYELSLS